MKRKKADFAGSWYPGEPEECKLQIRQFINESKKISGDFVGGIVPHAGWYFSGALACEVIQALKSSQNAYETFIVFGMHMHPASSPCILTQGIWETPLGDIEINSKLASIIAETENLNSLDATSFPSENTIELQLPFIKYFFPDAAIVPIGVPPCSLAESIGKSVAGAAKKLGINIGVLGSTDLTHYGINYDFTPAGSGKQALEWVIENNDKKAINAIKSMNPEAIIMQGLKNHNICCPGAVAAAAAAAKKLGAVKGIELNYTTSYEKSPGHSFVGYTGILFER